MNYIKGNYRQAIYENESGYKVGLFKVKETNDEEMLDYLNKVITFTGYFADLNKEDKYIFYGEIKNHERYGAQYVVKTYEKIVPEGKDAIVEFLASSLIKSCGEKTALSIVETLGEDAIKKIKEGYENLLLVPNITEKRAKTIYNSIMKYSSSDDMMIKLKELGFSIKEITNIINIYNEKTLDALEENMYLFKEIVAFDKIDNIFLKNHEKDDMIRIKACILESMNRLSFMNGDTYYHIDELASALKTIFKLNIEKDLFDRAIDLLLSENLIVVCEEKYYLKEFYDMEINIAATMLEINSNVPDTYENIDSVISKIEKKNNIKFDKVQKTAITNSLNNNVTIITGGPGTGKTTIVKAIVEAYIALNKYEPLDVIRNIELLAPTGRASKKLSEITTLPAKTIHRFLKWHKESNTFMYNEDNKYFKKLVIVDEVSMIDTFLFDALLKGINSDLKLILIGDENQLPSVGGGLILNDLIASNVFSHTLLKKIFRQKSESYIPYLSKEIKEKSLSADYKLKRKDFNFIETPGNQIKNTVEQIIGLATNKGLTEKDIIVLAPMYKGENGIDNLNNLLQNIFNPKNKNKNELHVADIVYRECDKVIQLNNDVEHNVFNGDIGYIDEVNIRSKEVLLVNFDGNYVPYRKEDLIHLKHAYAISIHKSQGSEFDHVILPITSSYNKMLYNKLIYTGVSRAKKSLTIIGSSLAFERSIENNYSVNRKTTLIARLVNKN